MGLKVERVYRTRITKSAAGLGVPPLCVSMVLAYLALDAANKFAPQDPTKYLFVGIPATISALILLSVGLVCFHFLNREIAIKDTQLTYTDSKTLMTLDVGEMAFSPPAEDARIKTLMFSDGETFVQIPELFLGAKEFKELLTILKKIRKVKNESLQKTYSL